MENNQIYTHSENRHQSRASFLGEKIGSGLSSGLAISIKYAIPFAAGFYVGMTDGNNLEIEPIIKYTLLTAPTVANMGLSGLVGGLAKAIGKLSKNPKFRGEVLSKLELRLVELQLNPAKAQEAYSKLKQLADISVTKVVAKTAVKPGIMTAIGYATGYGCAKISQ